MLNGESSSVGTKWFRYYNSLFEVYLTALYFLSDHSFWSWCVKPHTVFILWLLTLYTLTSVCIFSILFFIHFPRCWQGEFVIQSKVSLPGDHFLYSHDLNVWFRSDIVGRNEKLVTLRVKRVNWLSIIDCDDM